MARKLDTAAPSRRDFLKTAGLFGGMAAAGWPALGHGQRLETITASHSVSTIVSPSTWSPRGRSSSRRRGSRRPTSSSRAAAPMSSRRSRRKLIYDVKLPRPRDVIRLRETAEYLREYGETWHALGEEFQDRA